MTIPTGPGVEFRMTQTGDVTISGTLTTSGSCAVGRDLVYDPDDELISLEDHAASMWANRHLPAAGPTPEDAPFNVSDEIGRLINELEHAHTYIAELHAENAALKAGAARQAKILARLDALEARISD